MKKSINEEKEQLLEEEIESPIEEEKIHTKIIFPTDFFFGTSTASPQIETASEHQWKGIKAKDGSVFYRTTDHEKRRDEDLNYITMFGSVYRCSVDWAKLQLGPQQQFQEPVVQEYRDWFTKLKNKHMDIMFVLHHFTNPLWFENLGF